MSLFISSNPQLVARSGTMRVACHMTHHLTDTGPLLRPPSIPVLASPVRGLVDSAVLTAFAMHQMILSLSQPEGEDVIRRSESCRMYREFLIHTRPILRGGADH